MNPKNRIENIIIIVLTVILTATAYNYFIAKPMQKQLERQFAKELERNSKRYEADLDRSYALITKLALVERYKIENNFEKMKPKDAQILLQMTNDITPEKLAPVRDSVYIPPPVTKKEGFFQRLFHFKK